jgi:hypothetical protein
VRFHEYKEAEIRKFSSEYTAVRREYTRIAYEETACHSLIVNIILRNMRRCLHVTYMNGTSSCSKYTLA